MDTNVRILSAGFTILNTLILLIIVSICIYGFVLFVKLALRGIKALNIYIKSNKSN